MSNYKRPISYTYPYVVSQYLTSIHSDLYMSVLVDLFARSIITMCVVVKFRVCIVNKQTVNNKQGYIYGSKEICTLQPLSEHCIG